jgi:hypothetical protein
MERKILTEEEIERVFDSLPAQIQDYIYSEDLNSAVKKIGQRNQLHIDQMGFLQAEIVDVLTGKTRQDDFVPYMMETLEIDRAKADAIAQDVNDKIFLKIRESLQQVHELTKERPESAPPAMMAVPAVKLLEPTAADIMLTQKTVTAPVPLGQKNITPAASSIIEDTAPRTSYTPAPVQLPQSKSAGDAGVCTYQRGARRHCHTQRRLAARAPDGVVINLALKSQDEQQAIIAQFQNFLNSLEFTVQFFVESRDLDIRPYIALLEDRYAQELDDLMKIQIREYIAFIKDFTERANIMSKNFFIVVPYDPALINRGGGISGALGSLLPGGRGQAIGASLTDEQFEQYRTQLEQRMSSSSRGWCAPACASCKLGTEEVIELFYKLFNPGELEKPLAGNAAVALNKLYLWHSSTF